MYPTPLAASARGGNGCGGNGRGRGVEAGGGDVCLEMRKVRKGCIVGDGSVSRGLGVSIPRLCFVIH